MPKHFDCLLACRCLKFGLFKSEEPIITDVWEYTGLGPGIRHPLAYVMEACDDIAYSIIDAEDTVKKSYASFYDLMDFLDTHALEDEIVKSVVEKSKEKNQQFKKEDLSSSELNDISMQIFRVKAIAEMVESATQAFVENISRIMDGSIEPGFELIKNSNSALLCKTVKQFDYRYGFQHREVLRLELQGNNYIKSMMSMLWRSILAGQESEKPFERYVFGGISENYRRIYMEEGGIRDRGYKEAQLLCDAVSGMTEKYLIKKHDELKALDYAGA